MLRDIGRFVAASLDLTKWEHDMSMAGDTITMVELLTIAEAVTGKAFRVQKLSREDLETQLSALKSDQFMEALWLEFKLMYCRDAEGEGALEPVLNRLCPGVTPVSVKSISRGIGSVESKARFLVYGRESSKSHGRDQRHGEKGVYISMVASQHHWK